VSASRVTIVKRAARAIGTGPRGAAAQAMALLQAPLLAACADAPSRVGPTGADSPSVLRDHPEMLDETAEDYRRWASVEARNSSPIYERLALAVADDQELLGLLRTVPAVRRQPNLLFGALRWHDVPVEDAQAALAWAHDHVGEVVHVLNTRRTQTNEVARCATLLPALALLPQPLALIEVGASAGLCLLYDRWRYHYTGQGVDAWVGDESSPLTLSCVVEHGVPLPAVVPTIAWRQGLDLNPLDARDPDTRRWLQCLVWPEHRDRASDLAAALDVAAAAGPELIAGDLLRGLPELLKQLPAGATPVVVHSATLTYVEPVARAAFVTTLAARGVHRLGAEGPAVLPALATQLPAAADTARRFLISLDETALALAHPHGHSLTWL